MMKWLTRWWNRRRRAIDIDILWPSIMDNANKAFPNDPDRATREAHMAMLRHAVTDPAWNDITAAEAKRIIEVLE